MASEDLLRRMPERLDRREGDMTAAVSQNEADKREGERGGRFLFSFVFK